MNEHRYESSHIAELHALLVASLLGDATDDQLLRLNDLLLGDAELRRLAARFLEEDAVLRHQFQVLGRVGDFHSPVVELSESLRSTNTCSAGGDRKAARGIRRRAAQYLVMLAMLTVVATAALWNWRDRGATSAAVDGDASSLRIAADHSQGAISDEKIAVLPPVTRVSWSGPQFASEFEPGQLTPTMRQGVIRFTSVNGLPAHGYMVHLPPGAILDLMVAADADGENALSVIEFTRDGRPIRRSISFSNSMAEAAAESGLTGIAAARTRFGPIGTWSERNNSARSRYFLFTCVHKLVVKSMDDSWHVSRLSVMLDDSELTHIGWDDSGLYRGSDGEHVPDDDYDDLSATIRVHSGDQQRYPSSEGLRFIAGKEVARTVPANLDSVNVGMPILDAAEPITGGATKGFPFSVAAGEAVVIKITNRVAVPISIAILERQTGQLRWICEHFRPRLANIGFCAIENDTMNAEEFVLVCRQKSRLGEAQEPWRASPFSLLSEQNAFTSLKFESGQRADSYENLKVELLRLGSL